MDVRSPGCSPMTPLPDARSSCVSGGIQPCASLARRRARGRHPRAVVESTLIGLLFGDVVRAVNGAVAQYIKNGLSGWNALCFRTNQWRRRPSLRSNDNLVPVFSRSTSVVFNKILYTDCDVCRRENRKKCSKPYPVGQYSKGPAAVVYRPA